MREMKYRGKRLDNGEWVQGQLYQNMLHKRAWVSNRIESLKTHHNGIQVSFIDVDPATVNQYTGLKDPNGKEIFEGDIVKGVAFSVERVGVIVWINELAGFGVRYAERDDPTAWENSSILKHIGDSMDPHFVAKVIGNVHDNPSLLR